MIEFIRANRNSKFTRSVWTYYSEVELYIRVGANFYDAQTKMLVPAIAVANVVVAERQQRKKYFTNCLAKIEELAKELEFKNVYVEQVHNEHLLNFLLKNGYSYINGKPSKYGDVILVKHIL
jgi:hypothetical protein